MSKGVGVWESLLSRDYSAQFDPVLEAELGHVGMFTSVKDVLLLF